MKSYSHGQVELRHNSHIFGFHLGNQFTLSSTPEFAAAVKRVKDRRSNKASRWSLDWKINVWARSLDVDQYVIVPR